MLHQEAQVHVPWMDSLIYYHSNEIYTSGDYHMFLSGNTGNLSEERIEECRLRT
jgi:hypothetical protein